MRPVSIATSVTQSEASVVSPYRPQQTAPAAAQRGTNSDYPLHPQPVRFSTASAPAQLARAQAPKAQPAEPSPSKPAMGPLRKLGALVGIAMCSLGVVGGLVSIAALGPIGLAVAAGAAVVGGVLIKLCVKN